MSCGGRQPVTKPRRDNGERREFVEDEHEETLFRDVNATGKKMQEILPKTQQQEAVSGAMIRGPVRHLSTVKQRFRPS